MELRGADREREMVLRRRVKLERGRCSGGDGGAEMKMEVGRREV